MELGGSFCGFVGGVNGYLEWVGNPSCGRVPGEEGKRVVFGGRLGLLLVSAVAVPWCRGG